MRSLRLLLLACVCAAIAPVFSSDDRDAGDGADVPAWPTHFQGRILSAVPLSEREQAFRSGFPGAVARFTDGERDIVMRWVTRPTRKLHPAEDCYRGLGYEIARPRIVGDDERTHWRCFDAEGPSGGRQVCEQLQDREGRRWSDVSSWFWAATLRRSQGPWLVTTVASPTNP